MKKECRKQESARIRTGMVSYSAGTAVKNTFLAVFVDIPEKVNVYQLVI